MTVTKPLIVCLRACTCVGMFLNDTTSKIGLRSGQVLVGFETDKNSAGPARVAKVCQMKMVLAMKGGIFGLHWLLHWCCIGCGILVVALVVASDGASVVALIWHWSWL